MSSILLYLKLLKSLKYFKIFSVNRLRNKTAGKQLLVLVFFVSPDGYILTNNHVIDKAESLTVILEDETSHKAKVIGSRP